MMEHTAAEKHVRTVLSPLRIPKLRLAILVVSVAASGSLSGAATTEHFSAQKMKTLSDHVSAMEAELTRPYNQDVVQLLLEYGTNPGQKLLPDTNRRVSEFFNSLESSRWLTPEGYSLLLREYESNTTEDSDTSCNDKNERTSFKLPKIDRPVINRNLMKNPDVISWLASYPGAGHVMMNSVKKGATFAVTFLPYHTSGYYPYGNTALNEGDNAIHGTLVRVASGNETGAIANFIRQIKSLPLQLDLKQILNINRN